jgi:hypothetical protein
MQLDFTLTPTPLPLSHIVTLQSGSGMEGQCKVVKSSHQFRKLKLKELQFGPIFLSDLTRCLAHLKRFGIVADDTCRLCLNCSETIEQYIFLRCHYLAHPLADFRQWIALAPDSRTLKSLV